MDILTIVNENLREKLKSATSTKAFSIGLVVGEEDNGKVYLTHLAPLPHPEGICEDDDDGGNTTEGEEIKQEANKHNPCSLASVSDPVIAIHASQVTRMLPGGLDVLGIFITIPTAELNNSSNQGKIRTILNSIHKSTTKYYLDTRESSLKKLVLHGCTQTSKISVKLFDLGEHGTSLVSGTHKIQDTLWVQLNFNYSLTYPIYIPTEKSSQSLSKNVLTSFRPWAQSLKNDLFLIDRKILKDDDDISVTEGNVENRENNQDSDNSPCKVLNVEILENQNNSKSESVSEFQDCSGLIKFSGTVAGRAFVNSNAKASRCFQAVQDDLIRTVVSRWEMHCDSLVEEPPHGSLTDPVLHEPPRRVFLKDDNCAISLCDYLFPGDYVSDACQSAKELFDLQIQENNVDDSLEKWADLNEFRKPEASSTFADEKCYEEISAVKHSNAFQFFIAFLVGLLAMILAYLVITSKR